MKILKILVDLYKANDTLEAELFALFKLNGTSQHWYSFKILNDFDDLKDANIISNIQNLVPQNTKQKLQKAIMHYKMLITALSIKFPIIKATKPESNQVNYWSYQKAYPKPTEPPHSTKINIKITKSKLKY